MKRKEKLYGIDLLNFAVALTKAKAEEPHLSPKAKAKYRDDVILLKRCCSYFEREHYSSYNHSLARLSEETRKQFDLSEICS